MFGFHVIVVYFFHNFLLFVLLSSRNSFNTLDFVFSLEQIHFLFNHELPFFFCLCLWHHWILLLSLLLNVLNSACFSSFHLFPYFLRVLFFFFEISFLFFNFFSFLLTQFSFPFFCYSLLLSDLFLSLLLKLSILFYNLCYFLSFMHSSFLNFLPFPWSTFFKLLSLFFNFHLSLFKFFSLLKQSHFSSSFRLFNLTLCKFSLLLSFFLFLSLFL